jgi:hypothetical protein
VQQFQPNKNHPIGQDAVRKSVVPFGKKQKGRKKTLCDAYMKNPTHQCNLKKYWDFIDTWDTQSDGLLTVENLAF